MRHPLPTSPASSLVPYRVSALSPTPDAPAKPAVSGNPRARTREKSFRFLALFAGASGKTVLLAAPHHVTPSLSWRGGGVRGRRESYRPPLGDETCSRPRSQARTQS